MAIPGHVKRQAMDAVAHRETTEFMRLHGYRREPVSGVEHRHEAAARPSADVKRQALDAVSHRETTAHIRLVEDASSVFAPTTPSRASAHAAERVDELHRAGIGIEAAHQQITQDGFGRLYG